MRIYDARLMLGGWSSTIDPIQLADQGARLNGELPVKGMARLAEMCRDDEGSVRIDLQFERDPSDGLRTVRGTIDATVNVTCQRCMEAMALALSSRPQLLLLRPGERDDLAESGNAVVLDRPITLGMLVEDELLLTMPMVPMHPVDSCPGRELVESPAQTGSATGEKKPANPFSVLARLKRPDC
jgi:DUF177 domain-containing protein